MICYTYQQVYEYYARVAKFFHNKGLKILKTDTHNESGIWPISIPLAPILNTGNDLSCIELDEHILARAKERFPHLRLLRGDVRSLEKTVHYDLLLDFSTIDHLTPKEFPKVLRDYNEAADAVSVIVWLSDTRPSSPDQYFFNNFDFRRAFHDIFGAYNEIMLFADQGASLVHFLTSRSSLINAADFLNAIDFSRLSIANRERATTETLSLITNSRSWKVTAPLRSAARLANKLTTVLSANEPGASYHWEYMKGLNYRYEIVAKYIDFSGLHVVELCSGYTGLYNLVKDKVASFRACDVRKLHPICEQLPDDKFVKTLTKCDVLCAFGHGGYEITREELESKTLTESIHFVIERFKPRWIVLESVERFFPIVSNISNRYAYEETLFDHHGSDWLHNRRMLILGPYKIRKEGSRRRASEFMEESSSPPVWTESAASLDGAAARERVRNQR